MPELPPLEHPLTERVDTSYTLSADFYLDDKVFELEKQRIFYRSWQYVAHRSALRNPGDYVTLRFT